MASQLGSVTVSAVPDEQSGEVGGLQNTGTQLGASIGTALAGAVLISALTASFFPGLRENPARRRCVVAYAQTELAGGVPFLSDQEVDRRARRRQTSRPRRSKRWSETNAASRVDGLRAALAILALFALVALWFTRGIPKVQPGAESGARSP